MLKTVSPTRGSYELLEGNIRIIAILLSLTLSFWAITIDGVLNNDAFIYLRAAKLWVQGDWTAAVAEYAWPLYPILIAGIHSLSGLGLEQSAHLLNALLFALLVYAFISIVQELGASGKVLIAAALIILLHPELNKYRPFIVRDGGYWGFYLLSVWMFIKYLRAPQLRYALAWGIAGLIATLFRIEGLIVLILLPLVILLKRDLKLPKRLLVFVGAYLAPLAIAQVGLVWLAISPETLIHNNNRLYESLMMLAYTGQELGAHLQQQAHNLDQSILNPLSDQYALQAVIAVLITIFLLDLAGAFSPIYALLCAHRFATKAYWPSTAGETRPVLNGLIVINLIATIPFLMKSFFLTGRYVMGLVLVLMLVLPFHLVSLQEKWRGSRVGPLIRRAVPTLAGLIILVVAVDSLYSFGTSKQHLKEAGLWLGQQAAPGARLYSNEQKPAYYASIEQTVTPSFGEWTQTLAHFRQGTWREFDFLAIRVKNRQQQRELRASAPPNLDPVRVFENDEDDKVLIFQNEQVTETDRARSPEK